MWHWMYKKLLSAAVSWVRSTLVGLTLPIVQIKVQWGSYIGWNQILDLYSYIQSMEKSLWPQLLCFQRRGNEQTTSRGDFGYSPNGEMEVSAVVHYDWLLHTFTEVCSVW